MFVRNLQQRLSAAFKDTPVVFLNGARQTGKSTLIRSLIETAYPARYLSLDDVGILAAAKNDPAGFIAGLPHPVALDEVQRVPELFLPMKSQVDRKRTAGSFILTGSANVLLLPKLADSLAGRMEIRTLWPLSQGEIRGTKEGFIDSLFAANLISFSAERLEREALADIIVTGGFPEAVERTDEARRRAWFGSYITTILQRDVRDLARIEGLSTLPKLLTILAARTATLLNLAELSNTTGIPQSTLKRYMTLLETTYLIKFLPAWWGNIGKRLIKTPKVILCDAGVAAYLLSTNTLRLAEPSTLLGPLLETFVAMEIIKQLTWSEVEAQLFHFRTLRGQEVDFVLEDHSGKLVGIEVKASATVTEADIRNLGILEDVAGKRFHRGIVLYTGSSVVPFRRNIHAVPVQALWSD